MKVLKIWDSEYPWDVRAEKVMRSLTAAGHEVHLVARNRRGDPLVEHLPEATVHRLEPWRRFGSTLDTASQFPAFVNPRWLRHISATARKHEVDVILVRDLPLAPAALWAGRRLGVPVVMDMAENYPAMIRDVWMGGRQGPLDFAIRNPRLVSIVERRSVNAVDHTIVVVEESGQRLIGLGVDPDRVTVVGNTPWPSRIPSDQDVKPHIDGPGPLRMVYLGLLEKPRGLEAVLSGLSHLHDRGSALHLDVIGGGRDEDLFRGQASRLGLDRIVTFHGVLPYEEALRIFAESDVGLVPHLAVESWNTTIPNKLFDYMSHGLPVITSDAKPAARIVREEDCGVVFTSDDAAGFAAAVTRMMSADERTRMGRNGRAAVQGRYNWNRDGEVLVTALEAVQSNGRRELS